MFIFIINPLTFSMLPACGTESFGWGLVLLAQFNKSDKSFRLPAPPHAIVKLWEAMIHELQPAGPIFQLVNDSKYISQLLWFTQPQLCTVS